MLLLQADNNSNFRNIDLGLLNATFANKNNEQRIETNTLITVSIYIGYLTTKSAADTAASGFSCQA